MPRRPRQRKPPADANEGDLPSPAPDARDKHRSEILDRSPNRRRFASPVSAPLVGRAASDSKQRPASPQGGNGPEMGRARSRKRLLEEKLWRRYEQTHSKAARNALWTHYQPLVRYIAEQQKAKLVQCVDAHDLISAGNLGLLDSLLKFDRTKGVYFETFCVPRVRGAMLDAIRAYDWVPRLIRSKVTQYERLVKEMSSALGREPTDEELAARMQISLRALARLRKELRLKTQFTFETPAENVDPRDLLRLEKLEDPGIPDPTRALQLEDVRRIAATCLQEAERKVIEQYYFAGLGMREIGENMGLSESRICQIHGKALEILHRKLRPYEGSCEI